MQRHNDQPGPNAKLFFQPERLSCIQCPGIVYMSFACIAPAESVYTVAEAVNKTGFIRAPCQQSCLKASSKDDQVKMGW